MFSYAVKNATVIDGTRCKPYKANIYIAGDAIAEITAEDREAERSFDAAGLVAAEEGRQPRVAAARSGADPDTGIEGGMEGLDHMVRHLLMPQGHQGLVDIGEDELDHGASSVRNPQASAPPT